MTKKQLQKLHDLILELAASAIMSKQLKDKTYDLLVLIRADILEKGEK